MTHFEDLARQRRDALAGVPPVIQQPQMGAFELAARQRAGKTVDDPFAFPEITETGEEVGEVPTAEETREQRLQALGAGPVSRIAGAAVKPFQETQLGLPPEATEPFETDVPILRAFNELAVKGVASPIFAVLQTIGAGAEGIIDLLGQSAVEAGLSIDEAESITSDIKSALEVAPVAAIGAPIPFTRAGLARQATRQAPATTPVAVQEARNLPRGVKLTKGDITQDVMIQSFEEDVIQGLRGQPAQARLRSFREGQNKALQENVSEIQKQATGKPVAAAAEQRGIGAQRTVEAVQNRAIADRQVISAAYDEARQLDATIDGSLIQEFGNTTSRRLIEDGFDIEVMPRLQRRVGDFDDLGDFLKENSDFLNEASVQKVENIRKRIVRDIESVKRSDPSEAGALRIMRNDLDKKMGDLLDEGLVRGNDQAVEAWAGARELRREFGKTFENNKIIRRIIDDELTQEESVNLLFGGSKMGFKTEAGKIATRVRNILGADSDAFGAMKEEAILRLVRNQTDTFSGAKFNTAFQGAMKDNPTLMRALFTKEEIDQMNSFAKIAKQITDKTPGAVNNSATFIKQARFLRTGVSKFPIVGDMIEGLMKVREGRRALAEIESNIGAQQVIEGFRRPPGTLRTALSVAVAGPEEEENEPLR